MVSITLKNVTKKFGDETAVDDVNLNVRDKELLVLLGPSGCGKSTTLNILSGLEEETSGTVSYDDTVMTGIPPEQREIAMVFQSIALYPHINVRENIIFAIKHAKIDKAEIEKRLNEVIGMLAIDRYMERGLSELSGGERQRVAIAKALVRQPNLFLLDEPFSNLDAQFRRQLRSEIIRIHREIATTMIFVTHDQEEAMVVGDRIAVMNQGKVIQIGPPLEIYNNPVNLWISQFIGLHPTNIISAKLRSQNGSNTLDIGITELALDSEIAEKVKNGVKSVDNIVMGVRPEHIKVSPEKQSDEDIEVEVYIAEVIGKDILYELKTDDTFITAITPNTTQYKIGDRVHINILKDRIFVFCADSELCVHS